MGNLINLGKNSKEDTTPSTVSNSDQKKDQSQESKHNSEQNEVKEEIWIQSYDGKDLRACAAVDWQLTAANLNIIDSKLKLLVFGYFHQHELIFNSFFNDLHVNAKIPEQIIHITLSYCNNSVYSCRLGIAFKYLKDKENELHQQIAFDLLSKHLLSHDDYDGNFRLYLIPLINAIGDSDISNKVRNDIKQFLLNRCIVNAKSFDFCNTLYWTVNAMSKEVFYSYCDQPKRYGRITDDDEKTAAREEIKKQDYMRFLNEIKLTMKKEKPEFDYEMRKQQLFGDNLKMVTNFIRPMRARARQKTEFLKDQLRLHPTLKTAFKFVNAKKDDTDSNDNNTTNETKDDANDVDDGIDYNLNDGPLMPTDPSLRLIDIFIHDCFVFRTAMGGIHLCFNCANIYTKKTSLYRVLLKTEENDIKFEELTLINTINIMNCLLNQQGIEQMKNIKIKTYKIALINHENSLTEMVPNTKHLSRLLRDAYEDIHENPFLCYLKKRNDCNEQYINQICRSISINSIMDYVLGQGDRHTDNVLIFNDTNDSDSKEYGLLYLPDTGFAYGESPHPWPGENIIITKEMYYLLIDDAKINKEKKRSNNNLNINPSTLRRKEWENNSLRFKQFVKEMKMAFQCWHSNSSIILNVLPLLNGSPQHVAKRIKVAVDDSKNAVDIVFDSQRIHVAHYDFRFHDRTQGYGASWGKRWIN